MIFKVLSNPNPPVILWIEHQPPQAPQGEPKDPPDHPPQTLLHPRSPFQGQTLRVTPGWASSTHPAPGGRQTKELSGTRQLNEQEKPRGEAGWGSGGAGASSTAHLWKVLACSAISQALSTQVPSHCDTDTNCPATLPWAERPAAPTRGEHTQQAGKKRRGRNEGAVISG